MLRVILGGLSPGYELAIQKLIDEGINKNLSTYDELSNMLIENPKLDLGYSGAQVGVSAHFLQIIKKNGYDGAIEKAKREVELNRIFEYDGTIESIKNCNYKFGMED